MADGVVGRSRGSDAVLKGVSPGVGLRPEKGGNPLWRKREGAEGDVDDQEHQQRIEITAVINIGDRQERQDFIGPVPETHDVFFGKAVLANKGADGRKHGDRYQDKDGKSNR